MDSQMTGGHKMRSPKTQAPLYIYAGNNALLNSLFTTKSHIRSRCATKETTVGKH